VFGHDWQAGEGTVVDIIYGGAAVHGNDRAAISQRFLMDVSPSSGEPFRCEVSALLRDTFRTPDMGDVVQLKCDPGRKEAKFVASDPMVNKKAHAQVVREQRAADQARYDAEHGGDGFSAQANEGVRHIDHGGRTLSADASDQLGELERLAGLRERGALTDAEFERQKQRILGSS
jgi:Short C-terminal domain